MIIPITTKLSDNFYLDIFKSVQQRILNSNSESYYKEYSKHELDYYGNLLEWLYEDLTNNTIKSFIDIGCAYGTILHFVKTIQKSVYVLGIDMFDKYFNRGLGHNCHVYFRTANIETDSIILPKINTDSKYDRVFLSEVLEHFNFNPIPTMKRIHSLLTDNGLLYLSTPDSYSCKVNKYKCHFSAFPLPDKNAVILDEHIHHYSRTDLLELINMTGFEIVKDKNTLAKTNHGFQHFNMVLRKKV